MEVSSLKFDGWKGTVAYELDWREGWIHESILKYLYHKLVLRKPITEIFCFVIQNPLGVPANRLFRTQRLQAERLQPILAEHGLNINVRPVRRTLGKL